MHGNLFLTRSLARSCFGVLAAVALVVLFAACGSTSGSSSSTASTSTPQNTTPTSSGGGRYGNGGGTTPTASNRLKTATATVSGKSETILTNAQGMTLYYRTSDAPPATVCSGGCASAWPPLVMSGSGTPASAASLLVKLTHVADANGN